MNLKTGIFLIEVSLIHHAVLDSGAQQRDPVIYISFQIIFPTACYKILSIVPRATQ